MDEIFMSLYWAHQFYLEAKVNCFSLASQSWGCVAGKWLLKLG